MISGARGEGTPVRRRQGAGASLLPGVYARLVLVRGVRKASDGFFEAFSSCSLGICALRKSEDAVVKRATGAYEGSSHITKTQKTSPSSIWLEALLSPPAKTRFSQRTRRGTNNNKAADSLSHFVRSTAKEISDQSEAHDMNASMI